MQLEVNRDPSERHQVLMEILNGGEAGRLGQKEAVEGEEEAEVAERLLQAVPEQRMRVPSWPAVGRVYID